MFRITISAISAAAPRDGFIDPTTIEAYRAAGSSPATYAQSVAKERANVRYRILVSELQRNGNLYIGTVTAAGADAVTAPASLVLDVTPDLSFDPVQTEDETDPGAILTGTDAIKRMVARALMRGTEGRREIFDPTLSAAPGNTTQALRRTPRLEDLTTGPLVASLAAAEASVTVVAL